MSELDRPATMRDLLAFADTTAQGVGLLLSLALTKVAPDRADEFWDEVSALTLNTDFDPFVEQVLLGVESAKYDLDRDDD